MPDPNVTARLDQLAANVTSARGEAQHRALGHLEQQMIRDLMALFPDVGPEVLGSLLLVLGASLVDLLNSLGPAQATKAGPIIVNLLQLGGERLYTGHVPVDFECPYTLVGGAPCKHVVRAPDQEALDAYMRSHLALHHPDQSRRERRA